MKFFLIFLGLLFSTYAIILLAILLRRLRSRKNTGIPTQEEGTCPDSEGQYLIELINVRKRFDEPVLAGVNLAVPCGQTIGILGKSGTGKSVLLKIIAGFLKPDAGLVLVDGRDITNLDEESLLKHRRDVSYVFQHGAFFDWLDVRGNIAFPLHELGVTDQNQIRERVEYLLDAVELEGLGAARSDTLSDGAKKQVAIARALAISPRVILYDEPTTGVDPIIGKSLSRLIRKLSQQEQLTSIVVTHDLKCLEIVSDKIVLLKDGLIRFSGTPDAFRTSIDPFVQAFRTGKRYTEPEDSPAAVQA